MTKNIIEFIAVNYLFTIFSTITWPHDHFKTKKSTPFEPIFFEFKFAKF